MSMMYYYGNGYGFGLFDLLFNVVWWVLLIALIIIAIRWIRHNSTPWIPREKTPLDILKERYAKGEINKNEFDEKRRDLAP